ncbi:MAG: DUF4145 domain-containing protein [Clostridiales bacterium]|nr:DUF4145 domain-containing protein [Clostridiales bacterium]
MSGNSLDIKELTDNGLLDTAGLISRREYNLSLVKSRQTAELIVKTYAAEKGIEYSGLADTIENLYRAGIINISSRNALHNIRIFGNKAVHEADNDPEDAQKAYYLLKTEIQTFMSRKTVNVDRTPVPINSEDGFDRSRRDYSKAPSDRNAPASDRNTPASGESRKASQQGTNERASEMNTERSGRYSGGSDRSSSGSSGRSSSGGSGRYSSGGSGRSSSGGSGRPSGSSGRPSGKGTRKTGGQPRRGGRRPSDSTAAFYEIIKVIGPIITIVLIVIIIRGLNIFPSKNKTASSAAQSTTAVVETTAALQTIAPPVTVQETEPPVYEYRIKGNGVNVRYAENQNRIYTQLSNGTAIGTVTEIEGSDFVQFTLEGVNVVVNKNYIEPIQ